jgi:hypothetical protein
VRRFGTAGNTKYQLLLVLRVGTVLAPAMNGGSSRRQILWEGAMEREGEDIAPVASITERPVQVLTTSMRVQKLVIDRPAVVAYFQGIPADKQEIALVHALEIGITELAVRRSKFNRATT